jgi:TetR/AcrR family transcriptional regulator, transcriptional repressor for nem operon
VAPRRVTTSRASPSPITEEIDAAAELPRREAIPPLRGDCDETGGAMTEANEPRADTTRRRLVVAASRQFSSRSYSMVSLDDILAEAGLTKGAMYFHFPSKHALASAIIDDLTEMSGAALTESLARKMSGLETLVDLFYLLAVQNIQDEVAGAGTRLLGTFDNTTTLPTLWQSWIEFVVKLIEEAVADGDIVADTDPEDIAKMLVALWVGMQRISDIDHTEHYLDDLERAWLLAFASFTNPDRIDYFTQFIKRRHALTLKRVTAHSLSP